MKRYFEPDDYHQADTSNDAEIEEDDMASDTEPTLYLAGHIAPAGTYRMFGGRREVCLNTEEALPASLDGRVAVYQKRGATWAERQLHRNDEAIAEADTQGALNESFPAV